MAVIQIAACGFFVHRHGRVIFIEPPLDRLAVDHAGLDSLDRAYVRYHTGIERKHDTAAVVARDIDPGNGQFDSQHLACRLAMRGPSVGIWVQPVVHMQRPHLSWPFFGAGQQQGGGISTAAVSHGQWQSGAAVEKHDLQGWMLRPYSDVVRERSRSHGGRSAYGAPGVADTRPGPRRRAARSARRSGRSHWQSGDTAGRPARAACTGPRP